MAQFAADGYQKSQARAQLACPSGGPPCILTRTDRSVRFPWAPGNLRPGETEGEGLFYPQVNLGIWQQKEPAGPEPKGGHVPPWWTLVWDPQHYN